MSATKTQAFAKRPPVLSGIAPYTGPFGRGEIIHLLKRTMFGSKKADVDFFAGKTVDQVVSALLTAPTDISVNPLRTYADQASPAVADPTPMGASWIDAPEDGNYNGQRRASFKAWWLGKMINQERSVYEKMVLFWHNHFATESNETTAKLYIPHLEVLRRNALGNFKTFVTEMTLEPNMLRYLNGYLNRRQAPDENYARELQELFTLGKGPDSKYTEDDVKAAARVLTGWKIRQEQYVTGKYRYASYFLLSDHDTTNKQFSSFYGNKVITGRNTATAGTDELNELINMIFAQDEVAKYICRRIYRFFVYYEIDEITEAQVITPLADLFRQSNYEIKPVLKTLFSSEHFFDVANKGCLIKSPLEFTVAVAREFNIEFPAVTDLATLYNAWGTLSSTRNNGAAAQGQDVGDPPSVSGWPAYYQEPGFHEMWINTDTFPKRLRYVDSFLTTTGYSLGSGKRLIIGVVAFTDQLGTDVYDPNILIDKVLELLYRVPPSQRFKDYLKNTFLLDNLPGDSYWSDAWLNYKSAPTNTTYLNIVTTRLQKFYRFIVDSPEYQLS